VALFVSAMPPSSLEDRVRLLCAQAVASKTDAEINVVLPQLRAAIQDHVRVAAAETSIYKRLQQISQNSDHHIERLVIEDALAGLRVLKREELGFPDWGRK